MSYDFVHHHAERPDVGFNSEQAPVRRLWGCPLDRELGSLQVGIRVSLIW